MRRLSRLRISPKTYRVLSLASVIFLAFIIISGGLVRITGSGLGCPDWPTCDENRIVAPLEYHALVEFVNRVVTGLVSAVVIVAVLGSLVRVPRRRDLVWLSVGLVAGVIGQIVLGGLTVLFELKPGFVMAHFLLSIVILSNAVVLHTRASEATDSTEESANLGLSLVRVSGRDGRVLRFALLASAAVAVALGTVVTAAGPHGGDEDVERLALSGRDVTRLHSIAVWVFVGVVVAILLRVWSDPRGRRRGLQLFGALLAQGVVGYVQYFNGVPVALVALHIAGATLTWTATIRLWLHLADTARAVNTRREATSFTTGLANG